MKICRHITDDAVDLHD